ncbi:MAG: hypothetical protein ABI262_13175 [Microcoleus sp.]
MPEHSAECKCRGDHDGSFGIECSRVQVPYPPIAEIEALLLYRLTLKALSRYA